MEKFDLSKVKRVHFIGIGGISMSAIALILQKNGFYVQGSDFSENENVKMLKSKGIKVFIGHCKDNITSDIDIVVYSKAIKDDNEEMVEAKNKNIVIMSRSKILGMIMHNYSKKICVAGTHGKTTTTALISKVLLDIGLDPTINVGGIVDEIGGNSHIGENNNVFVAEACEYTNSFLDFVADIEVITNIEEDHLDFFKDLDDIRNSFKKFIELLPDDGLLVINDKIDDIPYLTSCTKAKVVTYGDDDSANYYYKNVSYDKDYYQSFDVYKGKEFVGRMRQKLIGRHNALNFLAAYAVLENQGISFDVVRKSLENFKGARRRLEVKGQKDGVTYIDDYAHHPTEIKASVDALKELNYKNLYIIFQPHTFSRTKALLNEFAKALSLVDNVILAKIYAAREKDTGEIGSADIKNIIMNINNKNNFCEYFETFEEIRKCIASRVTSGDIVVTMGAGDVYKVFDDYNLK
ncbi:MAG: UDP-N-acetylmuramate--L-alanine ligase [Lachnospiraceae bacterium]|nr:UDP-N-acetylmuramate--L-alanine ligase [Lachnospiraceae bacterium]